MLCELIRRALTLTVTQKNQTLVHSWTLNHFQFGDKRVILKKSMAKNAFAVKAFLFGVVLFALLIVVLPWWQRVSRVEFSSDLLRPIRSEALLQEIRSSEAKLKLLNVWATWCGPCIEEFPILLQLRQEYQGQGFELIFVSTDMLEELDKVEYFLKEQGLDFVSYIKEESDENFIRAMNPNWSGALPASFLYNQSGELVDFWTGDLTYEEFESKIKAFLN